MARTRQEFVRRRQFTVRHGSSPCQEAPGLAEPDEGCAFDFYDSGSQYCELLGSARRPKPELGALRNRLRRLDPEKLFERARHASRGSVDWAVDGADFEGCGDVGGGLPFDAIPRALTPADWGLIEAGVAQRVRALNLFLWDVHHKRHILKDGTLPADLVLGAMSLHPRLMDYDPPHGAYTHLAAVGLARDERGEFLVIEHNCRAPTGVRHVIENRRTMRRAFRDIIDGFSVAPVDDYAVRLVEKLNEVAPGGIDEPRIVILSAGASDPAYSEHMYLSGEMRAPLVEGRDLIVEDGRVFLRTVAGHVPVHIIYRRLRDRLLEDRALGVPGLLQAVHKGNVTLANAAGAGVVDDRAIHAYTPRIIRYYLGQDPILANVPTWVCRDPKKLSYALDNLPGLIVKPINGRGVCVGPGASKADVELWRDRIKADPSKYIAQSPVEHSVCPTVAGSAIEPRRVDLRPFAITGEDIWVLRGGLTRVALAKDSDAVNLAKGGGAKDTWVLQACPADGENAS
jgi:uncharacterized circularly permuted ATP-grasp superfamily protein